MLASFRGNGTIDSKPAAIVTICLPTFTRIVPETVVHIEDSSFDVTDSNRTSDIFACSPSSPRSAMGPSPPTLTEILHDVASPPWTLRAFTAYLSQNHCMEILGFTLDLQRYAAVHDQIQAEDTSDPKANAQLYAVWGKLVQVYIAPCSSGEINIPPTPATAYCVWLESLSRLTPKSSRKLAASSTS